MSETRATYGSPAIRISRKPDTADRVPQGRPRKAEYDNFALSIGAWFEDGKGTEEISIGPFWNARQLVRFRMGFPRSKAFEGMALGIRQRLRSRLSANRKVIYYYLKEV